MAIMTTASNMNITARYYLNCTQTVAFTMNDTVTTPFWRNDTTDTLATMSETNEIQTMLVIIGVMVLMVVFAAAAYRLFYRLYYRVYSSEGYEDYHDSLKEAIFHIAITVFTYVLYLFDTLSDVFLFIQYITNEQYSTFFLVMAFTILPVLFLAAVFYKQIVEDNMTEGCKKHYTKCAKKNQCIAACIWLMSLLVVFSIPAVIFPTFTYAQLLARGKPDSKLEYTQAYLTLIEATVEAAPQLTIQIYLLITDTLTETTQSQIIRYLSITASSLGLAWSLNAFKHQYRKTEQNQEDSFLIKLIHWVSRLAKIGPRIILLALITAEYSYLVSIFIIYRLVHGLMYVCSKEDIGLDLFLGTFGNIFCFSVSQIYQCHKKEQCGGIFFGFYYAVYYAENAGMLYFWYSDDPGLLHYKIGGGCSNHAWYAPFVFAVVSLGCVLQLSFLRLYYWLRKKQQAANITNASDMSE